MVHSQHLKNDISVIRVVFEFYPGTGGSITHIIELSKKINSYLKNQIIIAPDFGGECKDFDESFGIPIIRVKFYSLKILQKLGLPITPFILLLYAFNVVKKVILLVKSSKNIDIIHVHGALLGIFILIFRRIYNLNIPIVIMQHGNPKERGFRSNLATIISYFLMHLIKSDYFIILDDGTKIDEYISKLRKNNIKHEIVCHGIDTQFFQPLGINQRFRADFVILSTNRLIPVKRLDFAILSLKRLLKLTNYSCEPKLVFIGNGECKEDLQDLTNKYKLEKNVIFLGEKTIEGVRNLINSSDVVIGTSLESNLNRSIQEAMACEKPVVVFDSGGTNKLITHMENGLLVKPGDIADFAEKLKVLYENPDLRAKLGRNARETIIKERSWDTRIKKELEVYEKVLSEENEK